MLSKNRKNEKRMIAALMKCENSYVRYREMEGFQVAKNDMESRSKYSVWRRKEATCSSNNTLQQLTVNFY